MAQETPVPPPRVIVIGEEKTDVIIDTAGNSVKAQVIEILPTLVRYKKADNLEGPIYTVPTLSLRKIIFKNGSEEVFAKKSEPDYVQQTTIPNTTVITNSKTSTVFNNSSNNCLQGEQDANLYHKRSGGNFLLGFGFGLIGVGFAAIGDVKSPSLVYVSQDKINDPTYMSCYKKSAKSKNVTNAFLGAIVGTVATIFIISSN